jgi:hypothetical protein
LQGYEVPVLVLFTDYLSGQHNNKVISRCISNLIIVSNEDQLEKLPFDHTMTRKIIIRGETKIILPTLSINRFQ